MKEIKLDFSIEDEIFYKDDENDLISISSDLEFKELINSKFELNKLYVKTKQNKFRDGFILKSEIYEEKPTKRSSPSSTTSSTTSSNRNNQTESQIEKKNLWTKMKLTFCLLL